MDVFAALAEGLAARLAPADGPPPPGEAATHAAVVVLLRPAAVPLLGVADGSAEILFIRRAVREGDPWSGHIAFPGGHAEPGDADLLAGAVREVLEEVGVDIGRGGRVLGRLPTLGPQSVHLPPLDVTPFVALAPEGVAVQPDPAEVDQAIWLPLSPLRRAGLSEVVRRVFKGEQREWPAYPSPLGPIWGITERILTGFLALVE
jgi:8-oxo-dGTP pyrophosphatase MutT (NUDIX family)